jgi:osmotically inducible lipoprotein OsmB
MRKLIATLIIVFATTGCTTGQKQAAGIGGGAVLGGVAGSALTGGSVAGTVVGAGLGGWGGYELTR